MKNYFATASVFLPAKEVLSLHRVILKSREQDQAFGFDNTYLHLAHALRQLPKGGGNHTAFSKARQNLNHHKWDGSLLYRKLFLKRSMPR